MSSTEEQHNDTLDNAAGATTFGYQATLKHLYLIVKFRS
jgi:hypothetical protein